MDDAQLLRSYAREGSEAAFGELVRRHLNVIYSAAFRQVGGDAQRAEEVVQDVFAAMARNANALAARPVLINWLYTATRYTAAKVVRGEYRRRAREREAHMMGQDGTPQPGGADWERVRPILDEAIGGLDEPDRSAVLLRFFQVKGFAEIGQMLGINEDAARKRVGRALEKLRKRLDRLGVSSTAAVLAVALTENAAGAAPAGLATSVTGKALATAASGSAAFGTISLMANKASIMAVMGLALAGAIGIGGVGAAYREFRAAAQQNALLIEANQERATLLVTSQGLEAKVRAATVQLKELNAGLPSTQTSNVRLDPKREWSKFAEEFPEAKTAFLNYAKAWASINQGPLFKTAGLSQAEIDRLTDAIANRGADSIELGPNGLQPTFPHAQEVDLMRGMVTGISETDFEQAEQAAPAGRFIRSAQAEIAGETAGLSPLQENQIQAIIVQNASAPANASGIDLNSVNWTQAANAAQAVLSPSQWNAVEPMFENMQTQSALAAAAKQLRIPLQAIQLRE